MKTLFQSHRKNRRPSKHLSRRRRATFERLEDRRVMAVDFASAFSAGGPSGEGVWDIAVENAGNTCVVGSFTGTVDFDPGPGVLELTSTPTGSFSKFVAKYDSAGGLLWATRLGSGGDGGESGPGIAAGADGSVYVTGAFGGTTDFGGTTLTSIDDSDAFAVKLDTIGNVVWVKQFGGASFARGYAVAVDDSGNAYVAGESGGAVIISAFVAKIDPAGNILWNKQAGGQVGRTSSWARPHGIAVDDAGNVYTTGRHGNGVDFDPGAGTTTVGAGAFVWKLNGAGNFVWARSFQGVGGTFPGYPDGYDIAVDDSGNVYSVGRFRGTVDFNPASGGNKKFVLDAGVSSDAYVSKLDANGNFLWAKSAGGPNSSAYAEHLALDSSGAYISGWFSGTADFDPGAGTFSLTSVSDSDDAFVWKLDTSGNFLWAGTMGGSAADRAHGIDVDANGSIFVAGSFTGTADFDPGSATYNLTSTGGGDLFVAKLTQTSALVATSSSTAANSSNLPATSAAKSDSEPARARRKAAVDEAIAGFDEELSDLLLLLI